MHNPNDHRRLVLLKLLDNLSEKNKKELSKLEKMYFLDEEEELRIKYELWNKGIGGYLNRISHGVIDLPDGGQTVDSVSFHTNEKGSKALKYFIIPSETKDNKDKKLRWWLSTTLVILGIITSAQLCSKQCPELQEPKKSNGY